MNRLRRLRNALSRHGFVGTLNRAVSQPWKVYDMMNSRTGHFYSLELPVFWEDVVTVLPPLVDETPAEVVEVWREIREDDMFREAIESKFSRTDERQTRLHSSWREFLYVLVRIKEPTYVVETGVHDGLSSAYILAGLDRNGSGKLTSIDINDKSRLPSDVIDIDAGWAVPDYLQEPWDCLYDDSRELLPQVIEEEPPEMFLHDSLHTTEHMKFEFETAISAMKSGDLVFTDNSRFNNVFRSIAEQNLDETVFWKNSDYATDPNGAKIDDRFGGGIIK